MSPDRPSARVVLQRIRNRLIEYFEVASSFDEQNDYQASAPIADVPAEIINQWADLVDDAHLKEFLPPIFSHRELQALREFHEVWECVAESLPDPLPALEDIQRLGPWTRLRGEAASALGVMMIRGRLPEDRPVIPLLQELRSRLRTATAGEVLLGFRPHSALQQIGSRQLPFLSSDRDVEPEVLKENQWEEEWTPAQRRRYASLGEILLEATWAGDEYDDWEQIAEFLRGQGRALGLHLFVLSFHGQDAVLDEIDTGTHDSPAASWLRRTTWTVLICKLRTTSFP